MNNSTIFFANTACRFYPCHETDEPINCMFCYCPLYFLGDRCGGHFSYTKSGIKNCVDCTVPHERKNFGRIMAILRANLKKAGRDETK